MHQVPLHNLHEEKAVMTSFAGFELPLFYTSIIEEHLAVRNSAGIFDVSHMGRILLEGEDSLNFLEKILPVSVTIKQDMKAFYSFMLNDKGFIIDDLIVLKLSKFKFIIVVNAANKEKDLDHINKCANSYKITIHDITFQTCMFAVQGPKSIELTSEVLRGTNMPEKRYEITTLNLESQEIIISRTGYTGEDGLEMIIPCKNGVQTAAMVWKEISKVAKECGLGSRDTLRIEAGLPLYGNEIDEKTTPFELGLERLINWDKDFIGKEALRRNLLPEKLVCGLVLEKDIPRAGFEVRDQQGSSVGFITSGTYSPILKKGIALAKVKNNYAQPGGMLFVQVRNSSRPSYVVKPPFYDTSKYGYKRVKQQI